MNKDQIVQGLTEWWWQYNKKEEVLRLISYANDYSRRVNTLGWLEDLWDVTYSGTIAWDIQRRVYTLSGLFKADDIDGNSDLLEDTRAEAYREFYSNIYRSTAG